MKKTVLSLFTALVLLVSSIVPMGTISVSADNAVVTPEPLASLLADGKVKLADFSNLTEATLNDNIYKVEDGYSISVNSDANYTLDGADTSLRWDMPAINDTNKSTYNYKGFYIQSDYDLSQLEGYDYTLKLRYYASAPSDFSDTTGYYYRFASGLYLLNNATGSPQNKDINPRTDLKSTNVNKWATLDMVTSSQISELTYYEASKIYIRMTQVYKSNYPTTPYPIYIDSVWLELDNCDDTMTVTPSITDASNVSASSFNGYTLTFDKDIVAASDAVSVTKDGTDITSDVTATVSGGTINLLFANGVDAGSTYSVTVDKSKVRAVSGEYLENDVTYTFNVLRSADEIRREIMADVLSDGMIKLADFSNLTPEEISKYIVTVDNEAANDVSINSDSDYTINGRATSLKWTLAGNGTSKGFVIKTDYKVSDFAGLDYTIWVSSQAAPLSAEEWAASPAPVYKAYTLLGAESGGEVKFVNATGMTYNSTNSGIWRNAEEFYNNGSSKGIAVKSASASSPELLASCNPDDNANIYVKVHANKSTVTGPIYFDGIWLILNNNRATMANPVPSVADNSAILKNTTNTYTLTFDKNIVVTDDAITVTKDGVVLTPEITVNASVATIKFAENLTAGEYKVTLDSSKLRAVSGEALSADKTYRFTVLEDSNTIVLSADKLSACAVVSAGAYPKATLVAAVYDSKTLENVYTSEITNGYITISIPALAAGQTVKYMLIEDMTTLVPMQSCVEYTAN